MVYQPLFSSGSPEWGIPIPNYQTQTHLVFKYMQNMHHLEIMWSDPLVRSLLYCALPGFSSLSFNPPLCAVPRVAAFYVLISCDRFVAFYWFVVSCSLLCSEVLVFAKRLIKKLSNLLWIAVLYWFLFFVLCCDFLCSAVLCIIICADLYQLIL